MTLLKFGTFGIFYTFMLKFYERVQNFHLVVQ
jgi:hypothetical protein